METVFFDTHAFIKKLESSGVSSVQAEAHADALVEAFRGGVATKADLKEGENALRADMQKMETGIRGDVQKMESSLKGEFNSLLRWMITLVVALFAAQSALFLKLIHG